MKPIVYFDESRNTGPDLLNEDQPVFTLASVCIPQTVAKELIDLFQPSQFNELKFASLKKSARHMSNVLRLLQSDDVNENTVKVYAVHKRYMLTAKIVDIFYEPQFRQHGIDLYEQGACHGLANLIFTTYPVYLGGDRFENLLRKIQTFIREGDEVSVQKLRYEVKLIYKKLQGYGREVAQTFLNMVLAIEKLENYEEEPRSLDPIVPDPSPI